MMRYKMASPNPRIARHILLTVRMTSFNRAKKTKTPLLKYQSAFGLQRSLPRRRRMSQTMSSLPMANEFTSKEATLSLVGERGQGRREANVASVTHSTPHSQEYAALLE